MTSQEILQQAIQGVLTEKALSPEAITAVKNILDENNSLKINKDELTKRLETSEKRNSELVHEIQMLKIKEADILNREQEIVVREKKADLLDLTVKYEQTRVQDVKGMFETVFRNTVLRKNVNANVANPNYTQDAYNSTHNESTQEEVREE